jgi:hypothetical protein
MIKKLSIIFALAVLVLAAVSAPAFAAQGSPDNPAVKNALQDRNGQLNATEKKDPIDMGNNRLARYNNVMTRSENRIQNMGARGADTTGMQSVMAGAQSCVIAPLEAAICTGNGTIIANELRSKSLFNGSQYSYHYGAMMGIEGLKSTTARIEANATAAGYGSQIEEVKTHIANAEAIMESVGTNPYTNDQKNAVKEALKSATTILKDIAKSMRDQVRNR